MQNETVTAQHRWLHKLAGDWSYEHEAQCGPGEPPQRATGTEHVRKIGELWVLCEGQGSMPDGAPATMLMTLGFDPQKGRFVGTWVGSMMTHQWVYDGTLDAAEKVLTLESTGPDWNNPGKTARYRDVIAWVSDDHRMMTSHVQGADGEWSPPFMTANYRRVR